MSSQSRAPLIRLYTGRGVDLFAGGGGASEGIKSALGIPPVVAINHDEDAMGMHRINHPETEHLEGDVYEYGPDTVALDYNGGEQFDFGWFSPDCTDHSKAKGGVPFRDKRKALRKRSLAWVMVHWVESKIARPRVVFMENVQEWWDWGPLIQVGPGKWARDPNRIGEYRKRLIRRIERAGYAWQVRRLRAHHYGAPTIRERLFLIARCDGLPIVWPEPTHGPTLLKPYRGAYECIDFTLPMPSIFLTPAEARAWGKAHGVSAPKRPLANATLRRVARGVMRYVVESPDPFIVPMELGADGVWSPFLVPITHQGDDRVYNVRDPIRTITTSERGEFALVSPLLINTRNGERHGRHGEQAPRCHDVRAPYRTITALGSQGAVVAAFLAKHNGGHEATGQSLRAPCDTIICKMNKALVAATLIKYYGEHGNEGRGQDVRQPIRTLDTSNRFGLVAANLVHLRGGLDDHRNTASDLRDGHPTITAGGTHAALVAAFLVKYFGTGVSRSLWSPSGAVTTKDRFALVTVTVDGETWVLVDICMRMLTPFELFLLQGFSRDYVIDRGIVKGRLKRFTKGVQTRLCGNSVPPNFAEALVRANVVWQQEATA